MKIGVIGRNFGLKVHKPAFESLGCEVVMLGRDYAEHLGDVDAVSIAVPPEEQFNVAFDCLDEGIPFLCEKPFGASREDAEDLADYLSGHVAAVGFQFRYHVPQGRKVTAVISIQGRSDDVVRDYGCHAFDYMQPNEIEFVWRSGTEAVVVTDKGSIVLSSRGNLGHSVFVDGAPVDLYRDRVELWKPLARDFLSAVETGKAPEGMPTFRDAVAAWRMIEACRDRSD